MVAIKNLVLVALTAVTALAVPSPLEPRAVTWTCLNDQKNPKTKKYETKRLLYNQNKAESNSHHAPLSDGKTGSSYPHWFTNGYDGEGKILKGRTPIKFGKSDCDGPPKHSKDGNGKSDHYLLEFPTFPDGHDYKFDSKKPKEDPGPARVIYTYPNKVFCGIIAHTKENQGDLKLCSH
uniref:A-sarcin n=1 Tax=Talaromyces resedanus TaxID=63819 RepID=O13322_9EURO|nr:a-sarcin precursor [Talaromyces resedanus]